MRQSLAHSQLTAWCSEDAPVRGGLWLPLQPAVWSGQEVFLLSDAVALQVWAGPVVPQPTTTHQPMAPWWHGASAHGWQPLHVAWFYLMQCRQIALSLLLRTELSSGADHGRPSSPLDPTCLRRGLLGLGREGGTRPQRPLSQPAPSPPCGRQMCRSHPPRGRHSRKGMFCTGEVLVGRSSISRGEE